MSDIPKPSEVDADNIIKPSLDEMLVDHRQVYEEYKKDRQGNITPIEEIKFPPLQAEQVKPSVSTAFSPEQWAEIESRIAQSSLSNFHRKY